MHPAHATMKPNTALLFVLLGFAILRYARPRDRMVYVLATAIVVVAGGTLLEYLFDADFRIDGLLFEDHSVPTEWSRPGRMSFLTASCFVLVGFAVLVKDNPRLIVIAQSAVCIVLVIALLALVGLLYGADSLYLVAGPYASVAVHTVAGGLLASVALLTARADDGLMAILTSETAAGALLRRLTPAIVLVPLALAYFGLEAETHGIYDTRFGDALLVTMTVVILFAVTALIARSLHHSELLRRKMEGQLLDHERQLAELRERDRFFQLSVDLVGIAGQDGYFQQISHSFCRVLGYTSDELRGRPYLDFVHPADRLVIETQGFDALSFTNRFRCKDGSYRWLQWRAQPDDSGLIYSIARDITDDMLASQELQRSEQSLRASLREREVLLQEIHHRVKNNLQVISSLISMQMRQLDDDASRSALRDCQSRLRTIALVHEKLYQSKDHAHVPFSEYAADLVSSIFDAAGGRAAGISLAVESDPVALGVDRAIPCGLILNEFVSNALKHAFSGHDRGHVRVKLRNATDGHVILSVADDGVGIPVGFDPQGTATLGMQLICILVDQLKGTLEIERGGGTTFRVRFPANGMS
jgi:PAS domain S-box-containing protein